MTAVNVAALGDGGSPEAGLDALRAALVVPVVAGPSARSSPRSASAPARRPGSTSPSPPRPRPDRTAGHRAMSFNAIKGEFGDIVYATMTAVTEEARAMREC
ncbi:hypothetical protein ACFQX6_59395 [Streptosporangium lutulentum]